MTYLDLNLQFMRVITDDKPKQIRKDLLKNLQGGLIVLACVQGQKLLAEILKDVPDKGYWVLLPRSCLPFRPKIKIYDVEIPAFKLQQHVIFPIFYEEVLLILEERW